MGRLEEVLAGPLPPSYQEASAVRSRAGRFGTDVWLRILTYTADGADDGERAMGWHHLHSDVRFVCKSLYLASMHLLRSRFIGQYTARVRYPFTSDPFPTGEPTSGKDGLPTYSRHASQPGASSTSAASADFQTVHRETRVLDLFIAAAVYAGVQQNFGTFGSGMDSDGDGLADLFALHQPRARLEDLVVDVAKRRGLATFSNVGRTGRPGLAIEFRMRSAVLRMPNSQGTMRTVCEVTRQSGETLEQTALQVVERWRALEER